MRENIGLYRGKRIDNGEWVYGYYEPPVEFDGHKFGMTISYIGNHGWLEDAEIDPETVGEYTGLTANGKKIFEGDILKYGDKIGYVNYGRGCFCVKCEKPDYLKRNNPAIDIVLHECPNEVEIIGNIHDNPELLKGGADDD